jgi:hypothetical protein
MPYISEDRRKTIDSCIADMVLCIKGNIDPNRSPFQIERVSNEEFLSIIGDINYAFSRVISSLMTEVSYSKIAMITGVLENIKQEYYRRVASPYENKKIVQNGDIKEYKNFPQ